MLTFLKLLGIFFTITFFITCAVEVKKSLRKKKMAKLETDATEVGLSALTWKEMKRVRGVNATDFYAPVVREVLWKHYMKQAIMWFIVVFFISFGFNMFLLNIERLYALESICKPGQTSAQAEVRKGKTSKTLEGLRESDSMSTRINTCKDWGFNP